MAILLHALFLREYFNHAKIDFPVKLHYFCVDAEPAAGVFPGHPDDQLPGHFYDAEERAILHHGYFVELWHHND